MNTTPVHPLHEITNVRKVGAGREDKKRPSAVLILNSHKGKREVTVREGKDSCSSPKRKPNEGEISITKKFSLREEEKRPSSVLIQNSHKPRRNGIAKTNKESSSSPNQADAKSQIPRKSNPGNRKKKLL